MLVIMTSNASEDFYPQIGYNAMLKQYQGTLGTFVGPTKILISSTPPAGQGLQPLQLDHVRSGSKEDPPRGDLPAGQAEGFQMGAELVCSDR